MTPRQIDKILNDAKHKFPQGFFAVMLFVVPDESKMAHGKFYDNTEGMVALETENEICWVDIEIVCSMVVSAKPLMKVNLGQPGPASPHTLQ